MPRFVLLEHDHPQLHWDFMVERGDTLRTWRLNSIPGMNCEIDAVALPDHRLAYLDYEGPVSSDRGIVRRIDRGECTIQDEQRDSFSVELYGSHLSGRAELRKASPDRVSDSCPESNWIFQWISAAP